MRASDRDRGAVQSTVFGAEVRAQPFAESIAAPLIVTRSERHELIADADRALLRVHDVAAYWIDHGRRVFVDLAPGAQARDAAEYLGSIVAALVLGQQRRFALHASAVRVGDRAVLVAGHRGAGKSTTALRMLQRGHEHLSDDLCPLQTAGGAVVLEPSPRGIRVLPAAAEALGLDVTAAVPAPLETEKLLLPQPASGPCPVGAVVVLEAAGSAGRLGVREVSGAEALLALAEHAYRRPLVERLWPRELFGWVADVADRVPVHHLSRATPGWTVDEVADAVERASAPHP